VNRVPERNGPNWPVPSIATSLDRACIVSLKVCPSMAVTRTLIGNEKSPLKMKKLSSLLLPEDQLDPTISYYKYIGVYYNLLTRPKKIQGYCGF
jgi:hypothetical protein